MTHVVELDNYFSTVTTQERKESEVAQSCPTLCSPVDCSPPGSSVHGILQARILEWVPGDLPHPGIHPGLLHCRQTLYHLSHQGSLITQREVFLSPQMITLHTARTKQERESSKKRVECLWGALRKRQGLGKDVPWAHLLHVAPGG